jgi:hypothetical protein
MAIVVPSAALSQTELKKPARECVLCSTLRGLVFMGVSHLRNLAEPPIDRLKRAEILTRIMLPPISP